MWEEYQYENLWERRVAAIETARQLMKDNDTLKALNSVLNCKGFTAIGGPVFGYQLEGGTFYVHQPNDYITYRVGEYRFFFESKPKVE